MDLSERIAKDSVLLTAVGLMGRAVGMLVPLIVARWLGAGAQSDAFYLALAAPMFLEGLLATALHAAFGPRYAAALAQGEDARFLGHALLTFSATLALLAVALRLILPPLFAQLSGGDPQGSGPLAAALSGPLLAALPLMAVSIVSGSALEMRAHFLAPAAAPIIRAAAYLGIAGALRGAWGIHAIPLGYLAGEAATAAFLLGTLWRRGVGLTLSWPTAPVVRGALGLFLALAAGDIALHVNALVDRAFAATLPPGSLSALEYADRVRVIPEAVVAVGLLRVTFSHWSTARAGGAGARIRSSFEDVARWILVLLVPGAAALALLRLPVVALLFRGDAFDDTAVDATAHTLLGYLPGIPPLMVGMLAMHVLWIHARAREVVAVGALSVALNLALDAALVGPLGTLGLSLATSLSALAGAAVLLGFAQRTLGRLLSGRFWGFAAALVTVTVAVAAVLHAALGAPTSDWPRELGRTAMILVGMGVVLAGGALWGARGRPGPRGETEAAPLGPDAAVDQ